MQALVLRPGFVLEVQDVPEPRPAPGEVLVRVESAGICGSDVHGVATRSPRRQPPLIMGHEFVGTVTEHGPGAPATLIGRRVAVNPQVPCGDCLPCRSGGENVCAARELIGGTRAGGFAELVSVPAGCLHLVSDELAADVAMLAEPLATCLHAFRLAGSGPPSTVVVLGGGPIGLLSAKVGRSLGADRVVVSDASARRRESAASVADMTSTPGALVDSVLELTGGRGAELVIDAVGVDATRADSLRLLSARGVAVWLGMHDEEATIPAFDLVVREQRIQGSFAYTNADFARAVELLEREPVDMALPVKAFSLSEGAGAFEGLLQGETDGFLKATLAPMGSR